MEGAKRDGVRRSNGNRRKFVKAERHYATTDSIFEEFEVKRKIMRPEEIDDVLNREPFQPVRVYLADGRTHDVVDAGTAHVGSDTIVVGVYDTGTRFPRWRLLSLSQITEIEPLTPAQLG